MTVKKISLNFDQAVIIRNALGEERARLIKDSKINSDIMNTRYYKDTMDEYERFQTAVRLWK